MLANGTFNATDQRPAFPWTTAHTNSRNNKRLWTVDRPVPLNYEIPMAWHHLIPWNKLRNSWSALAASGQWEVLLAWLKLTDIGAADTRIGEMQTGTLGTVNASAIETSMCWAQWNLVEGPKEDNRTDDPGGDGFDNFGGIKFSSNVRSRSQILHQIYTKVSTWQVNTNTVSGADAKLLLGLFAQLKSYKNSPISLFEPKAWVIVNAGRIDGYGLTTSGGRHPTWKKA